MTDALSPLQQAKIDALAAEARSKLAEAAFSEVRSEYAQLELVQARRLEEEKLSKDFYHHVYRFSDDVDEMSVGRAIEILSAWHRLSPGCDIDFVITSPGGSIVDGLALYDFIQFLRRSGHKVTTTALGIAASMGGILLQAGDRRVAYRGASILIHEAAFFAAGKPGQVEDTVEWVKKMQDHLLDILAERSKMSRTQIKTKWTRKDWWLSADEALKLGFVDEVL